MPLADSSVRHPRHRLSRRRDIQRRRIVVTNTYSYNKRRLLTGETISQPSWYNWTLGYAYNTNGHPSSLTYLGGLVVDYAPNALGQPSKVGTYATGISYFPNGAVKNFTYGNGIVHTLTQNSRLLPSRSQDKNGATAILDDSYVYDENGNVTDIMDQAQAGLTDRGMAYDGLDRLSTAVAPGMWGNATYTYDALDNLRVTALGTSGYTYGYDSNNRLSTLTNTVGSVSSYYTDARGNITGDGKQAYQFDVANRLSSVIGKETYRYDALGRRVEMIKPDSTWLLFHYNQSGQLLFDDRDNTVKEYFYLGNSLVATRSYVWGTTNYTVTYQHTDALGTPVAVTNPSKVVLERTTYSPYGAPLNHPVDGVGYTGHFNDVATGLTYMQQRYYDPLIGRFLSVDPMASDMNNGWNFNRYNYAANNPYRFTDPDGRNVTCTENSCSIESHSLFEAAVDYSTVALIYGIRLIDNAIQRNESPDVPSDLVGTQDGKSGQQGARVNNGPLAPEHGGTGDSEKDFGKLTGGKSGSAVPEKGYPEGTKVGENGISHRPASGENGPRIDIPANGSKPAETLHYPKLTTQPLPRATGLDDPSRNP